MKLNRDDPPVFGIPSPGYTVIQADAATTPEDDQGSAMTTTILCVIILVVLILIVIVILTVLYLAHPLLCPSKGSKNVEDAENTNSLELLVEGCIGHENATEDETVTPVTGNRPIFSSSFLRNFG